MWTDGSAKEGEGSYGWVLKRKKGDSFFRVASGGGKITSPYLSNDKLSSTRMEGFGLVAAKLFFQSIDWKGPKFVFCDSQAAIKTSLNLPKMSERKWLKLPNSDVWQVFDSTPTPLSIEWVKSHQDNQQGDSPLSFQAIGNVEADQMAEDQYSRDNDLTGLELPDQYKIFA